MQYQPPNRSKFSTKNPLKPSGQRPQTTEQSEGTQFARQAAVFSPAQATPPTPLRNSNCPHKHRSNHAAGVKGSKQAGGERGKEDGDRSPAVGVERVADFEVDGPVGALQQVARGLVHPRRRRQPRRRRARGHRVHHPLPPPPPP